MDKETCSHHLKSKIKENCLYGYAIEFKRPHVDRFEVSWKKKIYLTKKEAIDAIAQMKRSYSFYNESEWNIVELYCH